MIINVDVHNVTLLMQVPFVPVGGEIITPNKAFSIHEVGMG